MAFYHNASKKLNIFPMKNLYFDVLFFKEKKNLAKLRKIKEKIIAFVYLNKIVNISKKRSLVNHMNAEISAEVPCCCWSDGCNCWEFPIFVKQASKWM